MAANKLTVSFTKLLVPHSVVLRWWLVFEGSRKERTNANGCGVEKPIHLLVELEQAVSLSLLRRRSVAPLIVSRRWLLSSLPRSSASSPGCRTSKEAYCSLRSHLVTLVPPDPRLLPFLLFSLQLVWVEQRNKLPLAKRRLLSSTLHERNRTSRQEHASAASVEERHQSRRPLAPTVSRQRR